MRDRMPGCARRRRAISPGSPLHRAVRQQLEDVIYSGSTACETAENATRETVQYNCGQHPGSALSRRTTFLMAQFTENSHALESSTGTRIMRLLLAAMSPRVIDICQSSPKDSHCAVLPDASAARHFRHFFGSAGGWTRGPRATRKHGSTPVHTSYIHCRRDADVRLPSGSHARTAELKFSTHSRCLAPKQLRSGQQLDTGSPSLMRFRGW